MGLDVQITEIEGQIASLQALDSEEQHQIQDVLEELKTCYAALVAARDNLHASVISRAVQDDVVYSSESATLLKEACEDSSMEISGTDSDSSVTGERQGNASETDRGSLRRPDILEEEEEEEDGKLSGQNRDGCGTRRRRRRIPPVTRRRLRWTCAKSWALTTDGAWKNDATLARLLQEARSSYSTGVNSRTTARIWGLILGGLLEEGHLVAFAERQLNGKVKWYPGVVRQLSYTTKSPVERDSPLSPSASPKRVNTGLLENVCSTALSSVDFTADLEPGDFRSCPVAPLHEQSLGEELDRALVAFAAPLKTYQIPCLNSAVGRCAFGHRCRYSHGVWVQAQDMRPLFWNPLLHLSETSDVYYLPDDGSRPHAGLWKKGRITRAPPESSSLTIEDAVDGRLVTLEAWDRHSILPVVHGSDCSSFLPGDGEVAHGESRSPSPSSPSLCSDDAQGEKDFALVSDGEDEEDEEKVFNGSCSGDPFDVSAFSHSLEVPKGATRSPSPSLQSLLADDPKLQSASEHHPQREADLDDGFAFWEKHTKGFGSRMLMKMGYKPGQPLSPPSWKPGNRPKLTKPLPIRVLPPRTGLDFLRPDTSSSSSRRRRGGNARRAGVIELEFRRSGLEELEERQKRLEKHQVSTGAFGLLNQAMNAHRNHCSGPSDASPIPVPPPKSQNGETVASELGLRQELLSLQQQLQQAQQELQRLTEQFNRHAGAGGVQCLRTRYKDHVQCQRKAIEDLQSRRQQILQNLQLRSKQDHYKIF